MTYITFQQNGQWTSFASQSMVGTIGQLVTLAAVGFPAGGSYAWADLPNYTAINPILSTNGGGSSSFTPDVPGTYQFSLRDAGSNEVDRRDFIVPTADGFMIPAFKSNASTFVPDQSGLGYKQAINNILSAVRVQLLGDVTGPLTGTIIKTLTGYSGTVGGAGRQVDMNADYLVWSNTRSPHISQSLPDAGNGKDFTISAQSGAANSSGGGLVLQAGSGATLPLGNNGIRLYSTNDGNMLVAQSGSVFTAGRRLYVTEVNATPFVVTSSHDVLAVTIAGPVSITLPSQPAKGTRIVIKDVLGLAAPATAFYVTGSATDKIDGSPVMIMSASYGIRTLVFFSSSVRTSWMSM